MNATLLASEYFDSRFTSMSEHFEVHKKIRDFYSSNLHPEQWKVEARRIFATRLALLQLHVLGIAQGGGHDLPHARNLLLDSGVHACGNILFQAQGWRNLSVSGLVSLLLLAYGVWLSTIEIEGTVLLVWLFRKGLVLALERMRDINFDDMNGFIDLRLDWLKERMRDGLHMPNLIRRFNS